MNRMQREVDRNVARATGESVGEISRRGFVMLSRMPFELDPETYIVDWDNIEGSREEIDRKNLKRRSSKRAYI